MTKRRITRERYVIVCPQGLGDALQATPMIAALREARPRAEITVVVLREVSRILFEGLPQLVDRVLYLPYWEKGAASFAAHAMGLPFNRKADAVILAYPAARPEYALLSALIPGRRRIAHDYPAARRFARFIPGYRSIPIVAKHNARRNADLLLAVGITGRLPARAVAPATWSTANGAREGVIVHVGSVQHDGFDLKRWPERRYQELVRRLLARGYAVTLLSGPDERDVTLRIHDRAPKTTLLEGPLPAVARSISAAAAVVANDNGIAHLAAAVGTPVLVLFGPTPLEHAPYGPNVTALRPSSCPPCFSPLTTGINCVRNIDFRCIREDLTVDSAELALLNLLRTPSIAHY